MSTRATTTRRATTRHPATREMVTRDALTRARRGLALVPVLVLTTALAFVGAAFAGHVLLGLRAARSGWHGERALHAAEAALLDALGAWAPASAAERRVGEVDTLALASDDALSTGVRRTRLSARRYALEAWGVVRDGGQRPARRTVGRIVRLAWPHPPVRAALTALGPVTLDSGAVVLGADAVPPGWAPECAVDARAEPAVAIVAPSASVGGGTIVSGAAPPLRALDAAGHTADLTAFDVAYAALAAAAMDITGDSLLSLDERHPVHAACPRWFGAGSRDGAIPAGCTRRWPVVHAQHAGTVQLEGSSAAQGVLLVDGDLRIGAGVRFHGLLLVRGRVTLEGASTADAPMVAGAVVVRDAAMAGSRLGYARLQASQCAVRLALAGAGRAVPVRRHGWSERP